MSGYNYAENRLPIGIDLWGLQFVIFDSNAADNQAFLTAYFVNRETSGGKNFFAVLEERSDVVVVYFILQRSAEGVMIAQLVSNFEEFKKLRGENYLLYYGTENNWTEYETYFLEGKQLLLIGVYCKDECSFDNLKEVASSLNHEEVAHGIDFLNGDQMNMAEDHEKYYGEKKNLSPSTKEVEKNPKYKNSEAKKQLDEIKSILIDQGYNDNQ